MPHTILIRGVLTREKEDPKIRHEISTSKEYSWVACHPVMELDKPPSIPHPPVGPIQDPYKVYILHNNRYRLLLTIPASVPNFFSTKPLKWILFSTFCVLGIEGDLCKITPEALGSTPEKLDRLPPVDLEQQVESGFELLYKAAGAINFRDHYVLNSKIRSSLASTPNREGFSSEVFERDECRCVVTHTLQGSCDAAHIIPFGKQDLVSRFSLFRVITD